MFRYQKVSRDKEWFESVIPNIKYLHNRIIKFKKGNIEENEYFVATNVRKKRKLE